MADENGAGMAPSLVPHLYLQSKPNILAAWPLADAALEQELLDLVQASQRKDLSFLTLRRTD